MLTETVLALAGLSAGALNAVAGGGTFLSFPALIWAGVPPIMANATATFAALPGYVGSVWAYREDIESGDRPSLAQLIAAAVIGGFTGAGLLLVTPSVVFAGVVPWLLLVATIAFAAGPAVVRHLTKSGRTMSNQAALVIVFVVAAYGGYFNGGLGIMLLAAFGIIGMTNLHRMNGLKNLMSVVLSVASVVTYSVAGLIDWDSLLVLALSCAIGGYLGAQFARTLRNTAVLRGAIIAVGLVMTAAFFGQSAS